MISKASCVLLDHKTLHVQGVLTLTETSNGAILTGAIKGLTPGKHGCHIHEFGDMSKGCQSMGAHFNPYKTKHGDIHDNLSNKHLGDLGNIVADKNGDCLLNMQTQLRLNGSLSVIGRAIVVHAEEDDLGLGGDEESTKTGNAGDRICCGIIAIKEEMH